MLCAMRYASQWSACRPLGETLDQGRDVIYIDKSNDMVGVAQEVEHLVVAQVAGGSSPFTHPIKSRVS